MVCILSCWRVLSARLYINQCTGVANASTMSEVRFERRYIAVENRSYKKRGAPNCLNQDYCHLVYTCIRV